MKIDKELFLKYLKLRYQARKTPGNSGDEIIDKYYFCNIKREWDKTSQYIIDNIVKAKYFKDTSDIMSIEDKFRGIFLSRIHNNVDTFEALKIPQKSYNVTYDSVPKKQNPHAYRVHRFLGRIKGDFSDWKDSEWCIANHINEILPDEVLKSKKWDTFEEAVKSWAEILNLKETSFIIYQLALDTCWLFDYEDIDTFFILGPGAIRGLNMIYFLEDKLKYVFGDSWNSKGISKDDFTGCIEGVDYNLKLVELRDYVNNSDWVKSEGLYIHINDIEFNLCEFNKWLSKKLGWKTTLRVYNGFNEHSEIIDDCCEELITNKAEV